ncbi:SKI family transcriptional corepressor 2 [Eublepharis macularius]|uniref:SKI family transcriptional corepressor 2 n=1 Tax=Eublepharis macularius TaxID=481883 RepID=A0AA97JR02_EUBMA|nr:SKI family transcriptional corepressor 2 [Eublepharis macularius]
MASSPLPGAADLLLAAPSGAFAGDALGPGQPPPAPSSQRGPPSAHGGAMKPNQVGQVVLYGIPIVSLVIDGQERLCLAQISNTLLKNFSYNEIHNRRVALGITCVQCTPVQLEILRRAGAMPISSRRCGMITKREAERLCKSFLGENRPPKLPDNFAFDVSHECAWGCRGSFIPARYNSSRAKCIKCSYCSMYFSPNKFIFHSHRTPDAKYTQPDAANFNSWRRHLKLTDKAPQDELVFAWEDVKAMFNGGSRKRALPQAHAPAPSAGAPHCHPLGAVKAAVVGVGGGLLSPHLLGAPPPPPPPPELHQKRGRFDDDEELQEAVAAAAAAAAAVAHGGGGKAPRSYPVIPVPSKGSSFGGVLQKFPGCGGLFPHPYGFPAAAFSLCHKKEDSDGLGVAGQGAPAGHKAAGGAPTAGAGLSGLFWPGTRKDAAAAAAAFYPPFCMFWPPRTPGGLPGLPTYLQPPPQPASCSALGGDSPSLLRQAFLDLAEPGGEGGAAGLGTPPAAAAPQASSGSRDARGFEGEAARSPPAEGGGPRGPAAHQPHLLEGQPRGKGAAAYHHSSAFRPVGGKEDSESLAKLHHHHQPRSSASPPPLLLLPPEPEPGGCDRPPHPPGHRLLSPGGTSCSYPSEDSSEEEEEEEEEEEPEVDVESHKQPEEEEEEEEGEEEEEEGEPGLGEPLGGAGRYLQSRGLTDKAVGRDRANASTAPTGPFPLTSCRPSQEEEKSGGANSEQLLPPPPPPPLPTCPPKGGSSGGSSPAHHPSTEEQPPPPYKDIQKSKEGLPQVVISAKEDSFADKNKEHSFFITDSEHPGGDFWRNIAGEPIQETNSPHSLKKDVENMGKEELQKVLFEQIDLRRRLEQEFQVLKGTASFPVFNNFQDQMKRELAYREEMVQQLQIIPYAASLIRKEKLGTHLSKS